MDNQKLLDLFKEWCTKFDSVKREQMPDELSKNFMYLILLENDKKEIPLVLKERFLYQVIEKRSNVIGLKINQYVTMMLNFLSKSPGEAIMYVYYLKSKLKNNELNMTSLTFTFPEGFPSESSLESLWRSQKIGGENLLDMVEIN